MKLEPQGAAQGTIRNMNDDLLLNLLEDRELSLLQNATAFVGFHFLGVFSICHFESTLPSLSASWVGSRQAWAVPCRICSMVFASRMPPPLQEGMFVPQWYFCFSLHCWIFFNWGICWFLETAVGTTVFDLDTIWVFPKIGIPQIGWFIMDNPIKMDALGVPLFSETSIFWPIGIRSPCFFCEVSASQNRSRDPSLQKRAAHRHQAASDQTFSCQFRCVFFTCSICIVDKDGLGKIRLCAKWWCQTLRSWCIRVSKHSEVVRAFFVRQVLKREIVYDSQTLPIPRVFISDISQSLGSFGNAPLNETICSVTRMTSCIFVVVWNCWHAMEIQLSTRDFFEGKRLASSRYAQATCLFRVWSGEEERHYARAVFQGMAAMAIPRDSSAVLVGDFNLGICWEEEASHHRGQDASVSDAETWKKFNTWSHRMPVPNGQHPADGCCMLLKKGNPIKVWVWISEHICLHIIHIAQQVSAYRLQSGVRVSVRSKSLSVFCVFTAPVSTGFYFEEDWQRKACASKTGNPCDPPLVAVLGFFP